jgi:hypothetical protein
MLTNKTLPPLKISFKQIRNYIANASQNYSNDKEIIYQTPSILKIIRYGIYTYEIWDSIGIEYIYRNNQSKFYVLHISGEPSPYSDEVITTYQIINEENINTLNKALTECRKQYFILNQHIKTINKSTNYYFTNNS